MALDFAAAMETVNEKLLLVFPDSLTCNGVDYPCISPPKEQMKTMTLGPYEGASTAQFQMREEDRETAGITTGSRFTSNDIEWQVYAILGDPNDSLVHLRCHFKQ